MSEGLCRYPREAITACGKSAIKEKKVLFNCQIQLPYVKIVAICLPIIPPIK